MKGHIPGRGLLWLVFSLFLHQAFGSVTTTETLCNDNLTTPLVEYDFDTSEERWSFCWFDYLAPNYEPAIHGREEISPGNWALSLESACTTNTGVWGDSTAYVYGTWFSRFDIPYTKDMIYKFRWYVSSTQPDDTLHPAFRFRHFTPHNGNLSCSLLQLTKDGQFPNAPSSNLPVPSIYEYYWKPIDYIMEEIATNPRYKELRGIGIAMDLWDQNPRQQGKILLHKVEVSLVDPITSWTVLKTFPPFESDEWDTFKMGKGMSLKNKKDHLEMVVTRRKKNEFRLARWEITPKYAPKLEPDSLYRVRIRISSTNSNLPVGRLRVLSSRWDSFCDNRIYVDDSEGGTYIDGISIPGQVERTMDTYFTARAIIPGDRLIVTFDSWDNGGLATGTYYLHSITIEKAVLKSQDLSRPSS